MKRIQSILLAIMIAACSVSMVACNSSDKSSEQSSAQSSQTSESSADSTEQSSAVDESVDDTSSAEDSESTADDSTADNSVNLMDLYTFTDPEGVDYDQRTVLYTEVGEEEIIYTAGARQSFSVIYGKEDRLVYAVSVYIFETAEQAEEYKTTVAEEEGEDGTADGVAYYSGIGEDFLALFEMTYTEYVDLFKSLMTEVN